MTDHVDEQLAARLDQWRRLDPDPGSLARLDALVAAGDTEQLRDSFTGRLVFGTSGIRGPLGVGPNRMNVLVVRQVAAGLASWLGAGARVVVAHDARRGSREFADEMRDTLAAGGVQPLVVVGEWPTPLLSYGVVAVGAAAGVMITASHNPAADNGVKVFGADGSQLLPAATDELLAAIEAVALGERPASPDGTPAVPVELTDMDERYLDAAASVVADGPRDITVVHTALHGVSADLAARLFVAVGFPPPVPVTSQQHPDPDFPTVRYPNPEEPGALGDATDTARRVGADLVVANDPDGDRLGVVVPTGDGSWRLLTGDEVGALLVDHRLRTTGGAARLVVSTLVCSPLPRTMAQRAGVRHIQTLTGFKWIMRAVLDHPDLELVLAYEESLGYAVSRVVHDKDGLTAAVVFAEMTAGLLVGGATVADRLDEIDRTYGVHLGRTWSARDDTVGGAARLRARLDAVRAEPPTALGDLAVLEVVDHRHSGSTTLDGDVLPPNDALRLELADTSRVVLRPSGTEAKLKAYLHTWVDLEPSASNADLARARAEATRRLDGLEADLVARLHPPRPG